MRTRREALVLLLCFLVSPSFAAAPEGVALTIGHGWALVHEVHRMRFKAGEQAVVFDHIPAQADLSSLVVRARRVDLELREWRRVGDAKRRASMGQGLTVEDDAVVWRPGAPALRTTDREATEAPVSCTVFAPTAGQRRFMVSYRVNGFDWATQYQVAVRGELAEDAEPLSVDLFGSVRIMNPTRLAFADAAVTLVGSEGPPGPAPAHAPGILLLDEVGLPDPSGIPASPEFAYPLPGRFRIAARGNTDVFLAQARRTPANRLYVVTAKDFPLTSGPLRPLSKVIVFRNLEAYGLGYALPPGRVQVFLGGKRTHLLQEAFLPRSDVDEDIRIGLGQATDVLGARRTRGRSEVIGGYYEEAFEVVVRNERGSDILAEVNEKPPLQLEWNVVRSNEKYVTRDQRILFSPRIGAQSEWNMYYRLRVREPGL